MRHKAIISSWPTATGRRSLSAARTDAAADDVIAGAHQDRARASELTKNVLDQARADAAVAPVTPMAQREAMRRRAARLRAQRTHVLSAHSRAQRRAVALRALRYRMAHHRDPALAGMRLPPANSRAGIAVRAALSRLGRPYVWGATGPDQFDCSGLVQWSYAQRRYSPGPHHLSANQRRESRCHVRKCARGISSSHMPDMCSWRSATTWSSKRPTRVLRSGSARWAITSRSVGHYETIAPGT